MTTYWKPSFSRSSRLPAAVIVVGRAETSGTVALVGAKARTEAMEATELMGADMRCGVALQDALRATGARMDNVACILCQIDQIVDNVPAACPPKGDGCEGVWRARPFKGLEGLDAAVGTV